MIRVFSHEEQVFVPSLLGTGIYPFAHLSRRVLRVRRFPRFFRDPGLSGHSDLLYPGERRYQQNERFMVKKAHSLLIALSVIFFVLAVIIVARHGHFGVV